MISFIIGLLLGLVFGIMLMCCISISRNKED